MRLDCSCHVNSFNPCSIPGGCGSAGCDHTSRSRGDTCTTCPIVRPGSEPRQPHTPPVCDGDRRLLGRWLSDITNLVDDLTNPEEPLVDDRQYERFGTAYFPGGHRHTFSRGMRPADPLTALGGVAPINSPTRHPRTSGSRERPIPINATALDLTGDARVPHLTGHAWPEDQIGYLSAGTVLDEWIRDTRARLLPDHHLPPATVNDMVAWLRERVDLICDQHPQVADFAEALRLLRGALRAAAGQTEPPPEPCDGVTCARCDQRALFHKPTDTYRAECGNCGTLYTDDEYTAIVGEQAKVARPANRSDATPTMDVASPLVRL